MEEKNIKIKDILTKKITKQDILNFLKINILSIYIILNLLYILIGSYLVRAEVLYSGEFSVGYIYLFCFNIVAIVLLFVLKKYKKNVVHIFILLICIFAIISTIFAVNPNMALYGSRDRWEGLFSILYYFTLMFLTTFVDNKNKKVIVGVILFSGVIQCVCGICQVYKVPFIPRTKHGSATGFVQNPNFFGSYTLLCLSYAIGLFVDENKKWKKIFFISLIIIFAIGLLTSNAMSAVVGLAFVLAFLLIYCIKNKKILKFLSIIIVLTLTTIGVSKIRKTNLIKDVQTTTHEATQITKGNTQDDFGSGRMFIWKETLKIVPNHLLHGAGIDNFTYAFNGGPLLSKSGKVYFDKAHNEYLQILVTQGIFALISYLALYIIIVKKGIKKCFKNKETFLILPIIGYIVQAFFNISVINVAPLFYVTLGLCATNKK